MKLQPCPFCGAEATFGNVVTYTLQGVRVKCTKCSAGSAAYYFDWPSVNGKQLTENQARQNAADAWNRREGKT